MVADEVIRMLFPLTCFHVFFVQYLSWLNNVGLCLAVKGTRSTVDRVVHDYDEEINRLIANLTVILKLIHFDVAFAYIFYLFIFICCC